jgi:hypothetical protein
MKMVDKQRAFTAALVMILIFSMCIAIGTIDMRTEEQLRTYQVEGK